MVLALTTTLTVAHIGPDIFQIYGKQMWKIKTSDTKMMKQIKFQITLITAYTCVNTVISIIAGFAHTFPSKNAEEICYVYKIIEMYIPRWKIELCGLYKASYIIMALALPAGSNQIIYASSHLRFQIYLLLVSIKNKFETKNDLNIIDNKSYQKKASTNMVFIMQRFLGVHE